MIQTSRTILLALSTDLASQLSPERWDLSIEDAVRSLARVSGDADLAADLGPIAPLLELTPSGTALDVAYGAPDAPEGLRATCEQLAGEIEVEKAWFATNPETWSTGIDELREVIGEFDRLTVAVRRIGETAVDVR